MADNTTTTAPQPIGEATAAEYRSKGLYGAKAHCVMKISKSPKNPNRPFIVDPTDNKFIGWADGSKVKYIKPDAVTILNSQAEEERYNALVKRIAQLEERMK
jgi:hypothetical protein